MKSSKFDGNKVMTLYRSGQSITKIAEQLGCCIQTVSNVLNRYNIHLTNVTIDTDLAQKLYKKGKTLIHISKQLNCSPQGLSAALCRAGCTIRTRSDYRRDLTKVFSKEKNWKLYCLYNSGKSTVELARMFKVSPPYVNRILRRLGCKIRKSDHSNRMKVEKYISKENLKKIYSTGLSVYDISKQTNLGVNRIYRMLREEGIKLHDEDGMSSATFDKIRKSSFKSKPYILPSGQTIYLQGYEPIFLDHVFQEKLLEETEIVYRPPSIVYKDKAKNLRHYYPDFLIPKFNLIVEVKSSWILKLQTEENLNAKKDACFSRGFGYICIIDKNYTEFDKYLTVG